MTTAMGAPTGAAPVPEEDTGATEYAEYESGKVTAVLADSQRAWLYIPG